jgi:hypothetical protein
MLGLLLFETAQRITDLPISAVYLAPFVAAFDIVETSIHRRGCVIFPDQLPEHLIRVSSAAVRGKWILCGCLIVLLLVANLWAFFGRPPSTRRKQKVSAAKKRQQESRWLG